MTRQINHQAILNDLWFKHYTTDLTGEQRSQMVERIIDEHFNKVDITKVKANHPAHTKRESDARYRKYAIAEILADFIIRAEDDVSGLTTSPQTYENHQHRINETEINTDFADGYDDMECGEIDRRGVHTENNVYNNALNEYKTIESELFKEVRCDDEAEFIDLILTIQESADYYAKIYAEKYRKEYKATLKRIKQLDVERVATCEECGEAFYRHDMRRKYCDLQGVRKGEGSLCEVNAKRRREHLKYHDKVNEIA